MEKVLFVNAGEETGGGLTHIVLLLTEFKHQQRPVDLLVMSEGPVAAAARAAGAKVWVLPPDKSGFRKAPAEILRLVQTEHYTLVHTHGPRANLFVAQLAHTLKTRNVTWVATIHSNPFLDFKDRSPWANWVLTRLNTSSLKRADGLFSVSEKLIPVLSQRLHLPQTRFFAIPNGIPFQKQVPAKKSHQGFQLIDVARLTPVKNHRLLLQALAQADLPDSHLTLVGDGESMADLKAQVQALHLQEQVTFTGFLTHTQLANIYPSMDLSVLTSVSEGFPLTILEAADFGLPALATDVGDIHKMIPNAKMGFLIPSQNVTALVQALKAAYHDFQTQTLAAKGIALREYTRTYFSIHQQAEQVWQGYHNFHKES